MKKITKSFMACISIILAVVTAFLLPIQVAGQIVKSEEDTAVVEEYYIDEEDYGSILYEDETKRDEYSKEFITDSGNVIYAQYPVPIHYKDEDGNYIEYDNTLKETTVESPKEATNDEVELNDNESDSTQTVFTNENGLYSTSFYESTDTDNLVEIDNEYPVSWYYSGANKVNGKTDEDTDADEENETNEDYLSLDNITGTVLYEDIFNNIDLETKTTTTGIKDDLILKSSNAENTFQIEYVIGELTARTKDETTVELFNDEEKIIYTINAPCMIDNKGEISNALKLQILSQQNGELSLKLTADKEWIEDRAREYPITIDPYFNYGQNYNELSSMYVDSSQPNTNLNPVNYLYQGTYGDGYYETFIKINSLPTLRKGDMVVGATLNQYLTNQDFHATSYVGAYEITESWSPTTINWNNRPDINSSLIDYTKFSASSTYDWKTWNVTELVKKWYNGTANNGICLKIVPGTYDQQCISYFSSTNPQYSTGRPCFQLVYRNNKGLEDYWTYTNADMGSAGTVSVNDYSGNLVLSLPLAATFDLKMPANLSYVYNSYMAEEKYKRTNPYVGYGWKMNIQQTVDLTSNISALSSKIDTSKYKYLYTDGDGTEHYFKKDSDNSSKYVDEDGLKLELTESSSEYTITDKDKNKLIFNKSNGLLKSMSDNNNNSITIEYSGSRITKIIDRGGRYITFTYNDDTNKYVRYINDSAGRSVRVDYTNARPTKITFPDGNIVRYGYTNNILTSAQSTDGNRVCFTYSGVGSKGVTSITGFGSNGTQGRKITFDRTKYNTTKTQSSGTDGVYGNSDDIINIYQFDDFGRTVSVQSKTKDGQDLGAASNVYTSNSNIKAINKVASTYSLGSNTVNLLKNHNAESQTNWTIASWIETANFSVEANSANKLFGQKSLKINVTSAPSDARGRVYQNVYLNSGETYTLSAYVKTEDYQVITSNKPFGAVVAVTHFMNDGSTIDKYSEHISTKTDTAVNNGFRRLKLTFTVPSGVSFSRVHLALRNTTGSAYFDGLQLEKGDTVNSYNMLENSSFEYYNEDGSATSWPGTNLTVSSSKDWKNSSNKVNGSYSFSMSGGIDTAKNAHQDVAVSGTEDDTYILSGWAKGDAVPNDTNNSYFELRAIITYTNNTTKEKRSALFNTSVSDWQYSSFAFNLDDGNKNTNLTPKNIRVYLISFRQANRVYFDNLQLVKEPVPSYTYDSDGNLVTVKSNSEKKSKYEYADNRLTKFVDAKGYDYKYTYDDNGNLKIATTQSGAKYTYGYDSQGNATSVEATADGTGKLRSEIIYTYADTSDTENIIVSKDQDNNEITNVYDADTGVLKSVTDSTGTTTYTYNSNNGVMTGMTQNGSSVSYTYDDTYTKLTQLTHGNTSYHFSYDEFGNRTATSVGDCTLATYTYSANGSNLLRSDYGNGDYVEYTYDRYGNTATKSQNGNIALRNHTDSSGAIVEVEDLASGLTHNSVYDTTNRLVGKDVTDTNLSGTDKLKYRMGYDYDLNNNVTKIAYLDKHFSNTQSYAFTTDNLLQSHTLNNGKTTTWNYDKLGRITSKSLNTTTPISTTYTYAQSRRGGDYTTTKIETEVIDGVSYKYEYDDRGNITEIYKATNVDGEYSYGDFPAVAYTYDSKNQLTSVDDYEHLERYQYNYSNGNITFLSHYKMNNVHTWVPVQTLDYQRYSYSDSDWGDLLTSYNGTQLTYDEIGNPLNYRDGITMSWQNGRQLATYSDGTTSVSYTYDSSGMRTGKTVTTDASNAEWEYIYEGGNLIQLSCGQSVLDFSYDTSGNPVSLSYRDAVTSTPVYYYYQLNSRGDVIGLYDANGILAYVYDYDPYGKINNIANSAGVAVNDDTSIAILNPLRYRSYVYDTESGLYYLQSRYYDPTTCRFVNADGYVSTGGGILGYNMFAYCNNNPIYYSDYTGCLTTKSMQKGLTSGKNQAYDITDVTLMMYFGKRTNDEFSYNDVKRARSNYNYVPYIKAYTEIKYKVQALVCCVEFDGDIGIGFGAEANILGNLKASALAKTAFAVHADYYGVQFGAVDSADISLTVAPWDLTVLNESSFWGIDGTYYHETDATPDICISFGGYCFLGLSATWSWSSEQYNRILTDLKRGY